MRFDSLIDLSLQVEGDYFSRVTDVLTTIKSVNKTVITSRYILIVSSPRPLHTSSGVSTSPYVVEASVGSCLRPDTDVLTTIKSVNKTVITSRYKIEASFPRPLYSLAGSIAQ